MSKENSDAEKDSSLRAVVDELPKSELDVLNESDYTEEQYKKIRRKIDLYLLPLMWICYGVQQADKTGLSSQALFGIRQDTGLVGQQYAWLSTIFYLSYMVFEFPSNYFMQRVSIGRTLSLVMFFWGIIVLCTAFAKNWADLMVLRTIQGALECTISPSFMLIVGTWYKTREHSSRSIVWGTANAGFGIIVNLCMYAIGDHAEKHGGLTPWKGISYFLGSMTIVLSICCWFLLGTPREVAWLSTQERRIVQARIINNRTGTDKEKREWKFYQMREAFLDPSTYFLFISVVIGSLPNGGVTSFGSLVYTSFGFTSLETILYDIPRQAVSIIWFIGVAILTSRFKDQRINIMLVSIVPGFVGMIAMALLPSTNLYRWDKFGLYLITMAPNINGLLLWTFVPSNVAGRTKKSVVSSIVFIGYCAGNAAGSQFFQAKDAPRYVPAIIGCAICFALEFVILVMWKLYLIYANRIRDQEAVRNGLTAELILEEGAANAEADMTDKENIHFRYSY